HHRTPVVHDIPAAPGPLIECMVNIKAIPTNGSCAGRKDDERSGILSGHEPRAIAEPVLLGRPDPDGSGGRDGTVAEPAGNAVAAGGPLVHDLGRDPGPR